MKIYKFCFDLDGTICHIKKESEHYSDVEPLPGAVETLQKLKSEGHYIIIMTARNMRTHNNNVGKIVANQSTVVIEWLKKHQIPFDEIHFGKPLADFYVDDKAIRLTSWGNFNKQIGDYKYNERFLF
jgi:capsule biosynthesis phosphatase